MGVAQKNMLGRGNRANPPPPHTHTHTRARLGQRANWFRNDSSVLGELLAPNRMLNVNYIPIGYLPFLCTVQKSQGNSVDREKAIGCVQFPFFSYSFHHTRLSRHIQWNLVQKPAGRQAKKKKKEKKGDYASSSEDRPSCQTSPALASLFASLL